MAVGIPGERIAGSDDEVIQPRLTGHPEDRFHQMVQILDARIYDKKEHQATFLCPMGCGSHVTMTFDERGVALYCHGLMGCSTTEIMDMIGVSIDDLSVHADRPRVPAPSQVSASERAEIIKGDVVPLRRSFVKMTGSVPAALMLNQIIYWSDGRLRVIRDGHQWVAKSYPMWAEELEVTEHAAKKAADRLIGLGIVDAMYAMYADKRMLHYRLLEGEFDALYAQYKPLPTEPPDAN